ncbi:hypothetical protein PROFUN_16875, partial [Planoprotostelium fungivorum]
PSPILSLFIFCVKFDYCWWPLTVPRPTKDEVSNNSNTTHDCHEDLDNAANLEIGGATRAVISSAHSSDITRADCPSDSIVLSLMEIGICFSSRYTKCATQSGSATSQIMLACVECDRVGLAIKFPVISSAHSSDNTKADCPSDSIVLSLMEIGICFSSRYTKCATQSGSATSQIMLACVECDRVGLTIKFPSVRSVTNARGSDTSQLRLA